MSRKMVHCTTLDRAEQILREGLHPRKQPANPEWSEAYGLSGAFECYRTTPVYLAEPSRPATFDGCVALVVDVDGLALNPDIPLMCDHGFWMEDAGGLDLYVGEEGRPETDALARQHADQLSVVLDDCDDEAVLAYVREHGWEEDVCAGDPQTWRLDLHDCDPALAQRIRSLIAPDCTASFYWDTLLSPEMAPKLIELTGSACVLAPIPADRIEARIYAHHEIEELIVRFSRPELAPLATAATMAAPGAVEQSQISVS